MRLIHRKFTRPEDIPSRSRQILELVVEGHGYAEVARRLGIARSTVAECVHEVASELPGPGQGRLRLLRWWLKHSPTSVPQ